MIGVAAFAGLLLLGLTYVPGGALIITALLVVSFCAEFIAPFFQRGHR